MTAIEKLLKLADDAERQAAAYRLAAAALNGHAAVSRTARAATVLDAALEVDAARRARAPRKPPRRAGHTQRKLEIRKQTATVLETLASRGPMTSKDLAAAVGRVRVPISPLLNNGLIARVGKKQYKRTAKPFAVDWRQNPTP